MENNSELQLAWQVVENTGTHLFLTGKAGTGKTTFLRQLKEQTPKRMVVIAPTGIAAINAGGVTMHSFFQLPFAPYVPDTTFASQQPFHKFGKEKINIIRSMDLLVIDEVSMVRADLLDAIDAILRRYRDHYTPFGGVQLLMIGDLQQLTPVVKENDWKLLSPYYDTPFFFGSHALKEAEYVTIELKQVYRQSDLAFVKLLNKIRDNEADETVLQELNKRYIRDFHPKENEGYIRLTTHNYQAQRYNERQLALLPEKEFSFTAKVEGTFPEAAYPADNVLTVKRGAQIMFIKNDSSGEHRFYNGKIGLVTDVSKEGIIVRPNGETKEFLLETEEWTNSKYILNPDNKEITEEVEGTFRQYPIRLAWAITIHKSQGLTFERAIIDVNTSFAHGQVYVAFSRCKSLEGLVLGAPLRKESIICDQTINEFTRNAEAQPLDRQKLEFMQQHYFYELLCEQFSFASIEQLFAYLLRMLDEHFYKLYPKLLEYYKETFELFKTKIIKVADTFKMQYSGLIVASEDYANDEQLRQRIISGAKYFGEQLDEILLPLIQSTKVQTDNKEVRKRFTETLEALAGAIRVKRGTLLNTEQNSFTVSSYLKCKAVLTITPETSKESSRRTTSARQPITPDKIDVPLDIFHPELYRQIVAWRNAEAAKSHVPVYTIIQQKAIFGIVNQLPADMEALINIPYFGKKTAERYGDALLEMIGRYVSENNIDRPEKEELLLVLPNDSKKASSKSKTDTKKVTLKLFKQGMSIAEIAVTRNLSVGTIVGHLEYYIRAGKIRVEQFMLMDKIRAIASYILEHGKEGGLTSIKEALDESVTYDEIKLVLAQLESIAISQKPKQ